VKYWPRRIPRAEHMTRMGGVRDVCIILVRELLRNIYIEINKERRYNINKYLIMIDFEDSTWMKLSQNRILLQVLVLTKLILQALLLVS
jgi:hypothetical protein